MIVGKVLIPAFSFFACIRYISSKSKSFFILFLSIKLLKYCKTEDSTFLDEKWKKNAKLFVKPQNYPGHPSNPKVAVSVLKCSQRIYNFSLRGIFFKNNFKKNYREICKKVAILPPLGLQGLIMCQGYHIQALRFLRNLACNLARILDNLAHTLSLFGSYFSEI